MNKTFVKLTPTSFKFLTSKIIEKKCILYSPRFYTGIQANHKKQCASIRVDERNFSEGKEHPNVVNSPIGDVEVPNIPLHEFIFENISSWESKTAVYCVTTRKKLTYAELMKNSKVLAIALQNKFKLEKGNFLATVLPNCPEYPVILLAASHCGVITTTCNFLYKVDEIKKQLQECNAKLIFCGLNVFKNCHAAAQAMNSPVPIVVVKDKSRAATPEGAIDYAELLRENPGVTLKPVDFRPQDDLVVPFSSGTTGGPKGVVLTHRNLVANITQISHPDSLIFNATTNDNQDAVLGILPMFHIYGLVISTLFTLRIGGRLDLMQRFDPRVYVTSLKKRKIRILFVVPPLLKLLAHRFVGKRYLKTVDYVINAASSLPLAEATALSQKCPHMKVGQGYGMTETSPVITHSHEDRMHKLSSIGAPIASTKVRIVHLETGEIMPKGERGEIQAKGPQIMRCYFNRPDATKEMILEDGWLRTGDVGYYDDEGDFFIVERIKDLIKVKGFQVPPAELEDTIREHPKVSDVAVIGIPDATHGEVPKAFVVLRRGARVTEEEIKQFVASKLSSYKHLKGGVVFIDTLPKNATGKILRKDLRNMKDPKSKN